MQARTQDPAPQRIWDIGDPGSDRRPSTGRASADRHTAVAAAAFALSTALGGALIDASGTLTDHAGLLTRTVAAVAAGVAVAGGFVVLARSVRRVGRAAARGAGGGVSRMSPAGPIAIPAPSADELADLAGLRALGAADGGAMKASGVLAPRRPAPIRGGPPR